MAIVIKVAREQAIELSPFWDDIFNPTQFNYRCSTDNMFDQFASPVMPFEDIEYEDVTHKRIEK